MLTDFLRDQAFGIAWLGIIVMVWLGWAQEDPPKSWRWKLGGGSVLGIALTGLFTYVLVVRWNDASALEGRELSYGVLVVVEVIIALIGVLYLKRTGRARWYSWWIAMVVAVHFVPMTFLTEDLSYLLLGVVETVALVLVFPRLRRLTGTTSTLVGPIMGGSILLFCIVSAGLFVARYGAPWAV